VLAYVRIAKCAKAAEGRGVLLVPIGALVKQKADDRRQTSKQNKR
jgi:hypothetical protein